MSGLQALVASPDAGRRAALLDVLGQCGLKIVTAANVNEVRTVLAQRHVHVVFCEDGLPPHGFRQVLRLTKARGSGVPVVVSSLLGELDQYLEAMELGVFDFIAPPYRRADVESIVNSVRKHYLSAGEAETAPHNLEATTSCGDEAVA